MKFINVHILRRGIFLFMLQYCLIQFCFSQCWIYQKSGTSNNLHSVYFVDSLTGTAVGDAGTILRTTDGGATWKKQYSGINASLVGVSFSDVNHGMVIVDSNNVLYTNNGGSTWIRERFTQYFIYYDFLSVADIDSMHAVVVTNRGIYRTVDGGATWGQVLNQTGLTSVSFANASVGIAIGYWNSSPLVFRTTDAGATWINQNGVFNNPPVGFSFTSISVPDTNIAIAITSDKYVYRTEDGGKNWSPQTFPSNENVNLSNVSFADSMTGVIVADNGGIYFTQDGGGTWTKMVSPNLVYHSVSCKGINATHAVSDNGIIIKMINSCSSAPILIAPTNRMTHEPISQGQNGQFSVVLQTDFPAYITLALREIQAGLDSTFVTGIILDNFASHVYSPLPNSVTFSNVLPKTTYYWRVRENFTDGATTGWSPTWSFTTVGGSISGVLFNDDNADSIHDFGEPGLANWRVDISGKIQESIYTGSDGTYNLGGLDSGIYVVTEQPQAVWEKTYPSSDSYIITLGLNDSLHGLDFGNAYPWNTIEGTVYNDRNENGIRDSIDPGLANWVLTLTEPDSTFITQTDSSGHYRFKHVDAGSNSVNLTVQSAWEQFLPRFQQGYDEDIQTYSVRYTGMDFNVHKIPTRVKVTLTIHDNVFNQRDIWFGVRPGASYGIWGVDPKAKNIDLSEGEFEIPPPSDGLFDARFVDPRGGIQHFGQGSWTDIRDFLSPNQQDTFLVTFSPGTNFGGNYPMTIQWKISDLENAYPFVPTYLVDPNGNKLNMTGACCGNIVSDIITDPSISYMYIITNSPNIPASYAKKWSLISLPEKSSDDFFSDLFPTAAGRAFSYKPENGYVIQDTLTTGTGYWIYYCSNIDSLQFASLARLQDTVNILPGWNMIGSLSAPVDTRTITTIPPAILSSQFFGYNRGYSIADTLFPTKGYWIKASQSAKIFLNASRSVTLPKTATENNLLAASSILSFQDNTGNREQLYCRTVQAGDTNDLYEAPPLPPEGEFDARFSSNRILETISEKQTGKFPIVIQGAEFPVTLSWQGNTNSIKASIIIDGKETSLNGKATIRIANPSSAVLLKLLGNPAIPSAFALQQNYPNPFNPSTTIRYNLPVTSRVTITIYNTLGEIVTTLVDRNQDAGFQTIEWNAGNVATGVYFCRMRATSNSRDVFSQVRKMLLIR